MKAAIRARIAAYEKSAAFIGQAFTGSGLAAAAIAPKNADGDYTEPGAEYVTSTTLAPTSTPATVGRVYYIDDIETDITLTGTAL